jgi:hypothetical protein
MAKAGRKKAKPEIEALPEPKPAPSWPLVGVIVKGFLALAILAGVFALLVKLGGYAGREVTQNPRYAMPFAALDCDAPTGLDRVTFLSETRHLAEAPETVQSVDPELTAKLRSVFLKHPWVNEVVGTSVSPEGVIRVELKFRQPVMTVEVLGETDPWTVDRTGVLLPHFPRPKPDLPKLITPRAKPETAAGQAWPDDVVKRAADLAETYKPDRIEKTDKGYRLTQPSGKVLIVGY